ncbi:unnamed protein product [Enterobius vermicularis]|uniref:Uncharacterized protein n=1 Tax=Enterobius vermicularis TaxID=51028 RepID=A0A0N4V698_ENTVE|nr:unnamed protein product [Enterobius vermicularis]
MFCENRSRVLLDAEISAIAANIQRCLTAAGTKIGVNKSIVRATSECIAIYKELEVLIEFVKGAVDVSEIDLEEINEDLEKFLNSERVINLTRYISQKEEELRELETHLKLTEEFRHQMAEQGNPEFLESTSSEEDEGPEEISSKPKGLEKPDEHEILDEVEVKRRTKVRKKSRKKKLVKVDRGEYSVDVARRNWQDRTSREMVKQMNLTRDSPFCDVVCYKTLNI